MDIQLVKDAGAVGAIVGIVQLIKTMTPEKLYKWLPLAALALGVAYSFAARQAGTDAFTRIMMGLQLGLAAAGSFSMVKNLAHKQEAAPKS